MLKFFHNAKEEPKVFYCKHITPGVCAYADETILIGEETLKEMDKTFAGKPIYVNHQKVNLENLQQEADGYVAESFYLPEDGSHWAKIIIVSDKGHEAIRKGWKVSNAYVPDEFGVGGEWHNLPYNREVMKAHYTHLALVDNPRYEEAQVLTPEDFKQYKEEKRAQLKSLENSKQTKGEGKMFNLFKKTAVTDDLSKVMVELSNGSAVSIGEMVNSVEEKIKAEEEKKSAKKNALSDVLEGVVKVNGEEMTVKDLVKEYESKCNKCNEDEEDKEKKDEGEDKEEEKKSKKNLKKNADTEDKEEKKDADEEKDKEEKESKKNEDIDKRKEIDEIGGFLKDKGLSDEDIRFVIGLAEKVSYEKSEAGKDNEDEEIKEDLTLKEKEEKEAKKNAKELLEAEEKANSKQFQGQVVDTMSRRLARGQERYGSAK